LIAAMFIAVWGIASRRNASPRAESDS
jgi:hypothetical protein